MFRIFIILSLFSFSISSCSESTFTPNENNDLMVGKWKIDEVDNSAALVSTSELMHSIINEKFQNNNVLNFKKGADFSLSNAKGENVLTGSYGISANNEKLQLLVDNMLYEYEIKEKHESKDGISSCTLNSITPGETTNLSISKQ